MTALEDEKSVIDQTKTLIVTIDYLLPDVRKISEVGAFALSIALAALHEALREEEQRKTGG